MIQFTDQEVKALAKRAGRHPDIVRRLKQDADDDLNGRLFLPDSGIGNWELYYYCPACSIKLEYDGSDPCRHRCPSCGTFLKGEPYDSAWWGIKNNKNAAASHRLCLMYLITGNADYIRKSVQILTGYARRYPQYEPHGNIPYNGPGRACAQTLDEGVFLRSLAMAYDLCSRFLTGGEDADIRSRLLEPGAEFLIAHRQSQLHNHEVAVDSAIAVIGLILNREDYIRFSVYEPYGLLYQLEHGMSDNRLWFEGSSAYHYYALENFLQFEKFAQHTAHSHIRHPNYRAMLEEMLHLLLPDGSLPLTGDTTPGREASCFLLYEYAYKKLQSPLMLCQLNRYYSDHPRSSLEALIYGEELLPPSGQPARPAVYTTPGCSGFTILQGENGRCLLFSHSCFGGEHDHYDRLGISYMAYQKPVSADLGTTGYGARMHYEFYKNTGSHNTVVIGEENQSPACARLVKRWERQGILYVQAEADWTLPFQMPDSYTIRQWDEELYKGAKMTRTIAWSDSYFAEMFTVGGAPAGVSIDWCMHFSGERRTGAGETEAAVFSAKKPFSHFSHVKKAMEGSPFLHEQFEDGSIRTDVYSCLPTGTHYCALGPDNPSNREIHYIVERSAGPQALFLHVIETSAGEPAIADVRFLFAQCRILIEITRRSGKTETVEFPFPTPGALHTAASSAACVSEP